MLGCAPGRWPDHERADRIHLGLGLVALACGHSADARWEAYRETLVSLAGALGRVTEGPLPAGLVDLNRLGGSGDLAVVPWEGPGRHRVEEELLASKVGPVPRLSHYPDEGGPFTEVASLALLTALAVDSEDDRLPLALGVEGVLAWFLESDRRAPARNALAFALDHAGVRLRRAGRPGLPSG